LACADDQGVWHRDINPAYLLVTTSGVVKLTDFGIARIAGLGLTQVSAAIGTPGYMAPEQFLGEGIDQRCDIFACGVLLYRLLTGKPPFSGTTEAVMYKVLHEQPPPPSQAVEDGARWAAYDAVVSRAMAKRPADRFPDAPALRAALISAARGSSIAAGDADATVIVASAAQQPWKHTMAAPAPSTSSPTAASSGATALDH
jgi:eukaryotic-like serine/threonine-protein kinase